MKKILYTGLIVSSLANFLVASQVSDPIEHSAVEISQDGTMELTFISPYDNPLINIQSVGEHIKGNFTIVRDTSEVSIPENGDKYKITLKHKDGLVSCNNEILLDEVLHLHITPSELSTTQVADATIMYKPCYPDDSNKYHFETEHPYANNTNIVKMLPPLCPEGQPCPTKLTFATIQGETEKNYDFITISQGGEELGNFSGQLNEKIEIDATLPTKIHFKSDYSVTKSGVTVDLD